MVLQVDNLYGLLKLWWNPWRFMDPKLRIANEKKFNLHTAFITFMAADPGKAGKSSL